MAQRAKTLYGSNVTGEYTTVYTSLEIKSCGWNTYDKVTSIYCWGRVGEYGLGTGDFRYYLTTASDGADGCYASTERQRIDGGITSKYAEDGPTTVTHTFSSLPDSVIYTPKTTNFKVQWHGSSTFIKKWRFFENHYITCYYESPEVYITVEKATGCASVSGTGQQVEIGGTVNISTTPEIGYTFTKWNDGNTSATRTYTVVDGDTYQNGINYKTFTPIMTPNNYTITFNPNTGNCSTSSKSVTYTKTYGELPTPTKTGYNFEGWFSAASGGTKITSSTILNTPENQTLYAHWSPVKYTIYFNGNGSSFGSVSSINTEYDANKVTLSTNNYKKIGYKFISWNTSSAGNGIQYLNKEQVQNITTNTSITLYAQWEFVGDINYNNLFSLSNWGTSYSGMINENDAKMTIDFQQGNINIKDLTGKEVPDTYTSYAISAGHYHIPVKGNTKYIFKFNVNQNHSENDLGQFFLFYYTNTAACSNPHQGWRPIKTSGAYAGEFTTPADCVKIGMRFGIYSPYADITFSDIFICEKSRYDSLISKISSYKIRDYLPNFNSLPELPSVDIGYLFDGWRGEDNRLASSLINNQVKESQSSIIAYSFQRPITYTLHFNKNYENEKGSGIMANQTFTYDEVKKLTKNVFTRYRYKFINWKANIKNEERFFTDEEEILNLFSNQNDEATLYAQWEYVPIENTIMLDTNLFASSVLFDNIPVIEILIDKKVFFRENLK